jgi:hypothetical protein
LPPKAERRRSSPAFTGKDGGGKKIFLRDARARESAESDLGKATAKLRDLRDPPASKQREPAFGAGTKKPVESDPGRSTSGGWYKHRARS